MKVNRLVAVCMCISTVNNLTKALHSRFIVKIVSESLDERLFKLYVDNCSHYFQSSLSPIDKQNQQHEETTVMLEYTIFLPPTFLV